MSRLLKRLRPLDVAGCLLALGYGLPSLWYPFGNDQALHYYIGKGLLLGELPYVTGISGKPVGIFVIHALAVALFGDTQAAIRILELLCVLSMGVLIAFCAAGAARRPRDGEVGTAALLLSVINYSYADYWNNAHPEIFEGLLLLGAACALLFDASRRRRSLAVGALCGLAVMVKYTAAVTALPIGIYCLLAAFRDGGPERARRRTVESALLCAAGGVAVVALCVLPFLVSGNINLMWEVTVDLLLKYRGKAPAIPNRIPSFVNLKYAGTLAIAVGVACAVGFAAARRRRDRERLHHGIFLTALFAGAVFNVLAQGRMFTYHWIVVFPFCALLLSWALGELLPRREIVQLPIAVLLAAAVFVFEPAWPSNNFYGYRAHVRNLASYLSGQRDRDTYINAFKGKTPFDRYTVLDEIGRTIRRQARDGDTLCVRGFAAPIYQVAGLRCTSRHVAPWTMKNGPRYWKKEYRADLEERPPTFIVTFDDRDADIRGLEQRGYVAQEMPGGFVLMKRRRFE
jgi:hypothetical protein